MSARKLFPLSNQHFRDQRPDDVVERRRKNVGANPALKRLDGAVLFPRDKFVHDLIDRRQTLRLGKRRRGLEAAHDIVEPRIVARAAGERPEADTTSSHDAVLGSRDSGKRSISQAM